MSTTYTVAETEPGAHITTNHWQPCKARSLQGAKKAAQARRTFQGTAAHVGIVTETGQIKHIATRRPGTGSKPGTWHDIDS